MKQMVLERARSAVDVFAHSRCADATKANCLRDGEEATSADGCWPRVRNVVDGLQADLSRASPVPSPRMCSFLVLAEDRRFPRHPGFDPIALCRAAWRTSSGGPRQGGSTIAMQLVRTVTGRREPTLRRKAAEVALAARLTRYMQVENINRRFIDVKMIPARPQYQTAQRTLDLMSRLVVKLKVTSRSPSPPKASVRCYESWRSVVKQMSISLAPIGAQA